MLHLAEALAWHSTHSLALLNCHDLPQGEDYVSHKPGGKREYGESHHCCRLCLSFSGRLMIHYSWLSVCVEPGLLLPFKSKLNIHSPRLEAAALLVSSSLPNFGLPPYPISKPPRVCFQITPVYSVRWDRQTRWPLDYHVLHIQMHCLKFKRFPKLHPTHRASHPRPQDVQEQSCTVFTSIFKNMLKTLACPNPDDHFFFFFWSDLQVFVQAAETIYMSCRPFPSAAQPVCEQPQ